MKLGILITLMGLIKAFACSPLPGELEETVTPLTPTSTQWTQVLHPYSGAPADTMINKVVHYSDFTENIMDVYREHKNVFIARVDRIGYDGAFSDTVFYSITEIYRSWWGVHHEKEMSFVTSAHLGSDCFLSNETLIGTSFLAYFDEHPDEVARTIFPKSIYRPMGNYPVSDDDGEVITNYYFPSFKVPVSDFPSIFDEAYPISIGIKALPESEFFEITGKNLNIHWPHNGSFHFSLFNVKGKLELRKFHNAPDGSFDLSHLKAGIYFLRVESKGKTSANKFVLGSR